MHTKTKCLALASVLLLCIGQYAKCDTITVTDLAHNTLTGVFTYDVEVSNSAILQSGDGFVVFDFPGYIGYTLTLPGFSAPVIDGLYNHIDAPAPSDVTLTPNTLDIGLSSVLGLPDNPSVPNLSFVYNGPTIGIGNPQSGVLTLFTSLVGANVVATPMGATSKDSGGSLSRQFFYGYVSAPAIGGNNISTPLPGSALSGSAFFALLSLGAIARKRNSFSSAVI